MFVLDHVVVNVPEAPELPEPAYTVSKPGCEALHWRLFETTLMRPVVRFDRLANLDEIQAECELLSPPIDADWFSDHPSALLVLRRNPFDLREHIAFPNIDRMQVDNSDRQMRLNTAMHLYSRCVVHDDHLYVPSRPPTWAVIVHGGGVSLTCDIGDRVVPSFPTFYFGIELTETVEQFVAVAARDRHVEREEGGCVRAATEGRPEDGAIETVRCLAHLLYPTYSNWRFADLPPAFARMLASLKSAHDSDDVLVASRFLEEFDQTAGDLPPTAFDPVVEMLRLRNLLVHQANYDPILAGLQL